MFLLPVISDKNVPEITVNILNPILAITYMCKKWMDNSFTDFQAKFLIFETALCRMRKHYSSEVSSVAIIGLPFTVYSYIDDVDPIGWKDHA